MPKISFDLSKESINKAREQIKENFTTEENEAQINDILEQAQKYAIEKLNDMKIYGDTDYSSLIDSIKIDKYNPNTKTAAIKVGEVGVYVEFGTGVVGSRTPHSLMSSMSYDANGHGGLLQQGGYRQFHHLSSKE